MCVCLEQEKEGDLKFVLFGVIKHVGKSFVRPVVLCGYIRMRHFMFTLPHFGFY